MEEAGRGVRHRDWDEAIAPWTGVAWGWTGGRADMALERGWKARPGVGRSAGGLSGGPRDEKGGFRPPPVRTLREPT